MAWEFGNRETYFLESLDVSPEDYKENPDISHERVLMNDPNEANLIASKLVGSEMHKPVLDIDLPISAIPTSTDGHYHLYIDKEMSWEHLEGILEAFVAAGVVEPGYLNASMSRKMTFVRKPGVKKKVTTGGIP
jgi:hypothetical protein